MNELLTERRSPAFRETVDDMLTKLDQAASILNVLSLCGDSASCLENETTARVADVVLDWITDVKTNLERLSPEGPVCKNELSFNEFYNAIESDPLLKELLEAAKGCPHGAILETIVTLEEAKKTPEGPETRLTR